MVPAIGYGNPKMQQYHNTKYFKLTTLNIIVRKEGRILRTQRLTEQ